MPSSFDFATIRMVPRVEREEFLNAGVIVFCLEQKFLQARVALPADRLKMLWPEVDLDALRDHLDAIPQICAGSPEAGPIARLSQRERFHWLVAPRSTVIQVSAVHTGLCDDPSSVLAALLRKLSGM